MLEKIKETALFLSERVNNMPKTAIILGSGLGALVDSSPKTRCVAKTTKNWDRASPQ